MSEHYDTCASKAGGPCDCPVSDRSMSGVTDRVQSVTDPHAKARRIAEHWAALKVGYPPVTYLAKEVLDLLAREERIDFAPIWNRADFERRAREEGWLVGDAMPPEADAEACAEHLREAREVEAWQEAKHACRGESP